MKKNILSLFFLAIIFQTLLFSAEFRNGKFYLNVEILPNAEQIHIKSDGKLYISETDSPFQLNFFQPDLSIQLTEKPNSEAIWQVGIKKVSSKIEVENFVKTFPECYFEKTSEITFQNQTISQSAIFAIYLKEDFVSYEEAKSRCELDGWIEEKHTFLGNNLGSEILIYDIKNEEEYFLSAPFNIISDEPISVFQVPKSNFWNTKKYVDRTYAGNLKILQNPLGKMNLIANVELENYIAGVVPNEIGEAVPIEAMKAQAIAARSEALFKILHNHHKDDEYDLCAGTHCQVFSGISNVNEKVKTAVNETAYQICIYNSKIVNAVYSNNCGGITTNSSDIWSGKSVPYLVSIYDGKGNSKVNLQSESNAKNWILGSQPVFCNTENDVSWKKNTYQWQEIVSKNRLEKNLNSISNFGKLKNIKITKRGMAGRILRMKIFGTENNIELNNELKIRQIFGDLRSSFFIFEIKNDKVIFTGKGSGHGVGMCQMGAIQMAELGYSAEEILKHYYTGIEIKKIKISN